ncbi:molybdopterin-dependent oxidoreductase [Anaerosalibacter massiliensis]|uniref:Molybdopterin-dependent oxidoreductase n=1 Tax=Anaerosalibacter massiliensis TaxID=1347392 RepID=A0A9X2MI95_9FIRM|nr:molybdopterin-dependent oxidoreductase [Anaerosalibacter massiliensis]MCR2043677.1 molybdopterin-dependent oxidoreductase [Anaerosalibacter massiliensis]
MFRVNRKKSLLTVFVLISILLFTACSSKKVSEEGNSLDGEPEWKIAIETPDEKTVELTNLDMDEVGTVDIEATMRKKDGTEEENKWSGMPLKEILEFAKASEYSTVEIEAEDGFSVVYDKEIVESDGTILAVEVDGKKLDEKSGPVQAVVDGEGAKLWVRQVSKIKVSK